MAIFSKASSCQNGYDMSCVAAMVNSVIVAVVVTGRCGTSVCRSARLWNGLYISAARSIVKAAAAIVENIVMSVVMGVAALSVVMKGRVVYVIVVAAANGEVIVSIVMSRLQLVVAVGFLPDRQLVADFIYIEIVNGHHDRPFPLI